MNPVACVVGVGPGLGYSLSERFLHEGYDVAMMARNKENLKDYERELSSLEGNTASFQCDASDPASVQSAFKRLNKRFEPPSVLIYNAGTFSLEGLMETEPDRFEECWKANCYGAFLCSQAVLPRMRKTGEGTILLTGATASLRGSEGFATLAVGKFGLRALAQSMAREFGPEGIHVAHVIIDGQIDTPRTREISPDRDEEEFLDPDEIAEQYWQLHRQDPSTWTLELDLRPHVEEF